jgi:hypothetical protein
MSFSSVFQLKGLDKEMTIVASVAKTDSWRAQGIRKLIFETVIWNAYTEYAWTFAGFDNMHCEKSMLFF